MKVNSSQFRKRVCLLLFAFCLLALGFLPSAFAQGLDSFGGVIGWSCPVETSDPYPAGHPFTPELSYAVSSVARSGGTSTVYFSGPTGFQAGTWITVAGTTPDGGSFNTPANNVWTITAVSNANPYTITFAETGNTVSQTTTTGTVQEAFWYLAKIGSRWVECDPVGNGRWHAGLNFNNTNALAPDLAKYGDQNHWGKSVFQRLRAWGFNYAWYAQQGTTDWNPLIAGTSLQTPVTWTVDAARDSAYWTSSFTGQVKSLQAPKDMLRVQDLFNGMVGYVGTFLADAFDPNLYTYIDGDFAGASNDTANDAHWLLSPWSAYIVTEDRDRCYGCGSGTQIPMTMAGITPNPAWVALADAPSAYVSRNFSVTYFADPTDYSKNDIVNWLQGKGQDAQSMVTSASCNASGNAATFSVYQNWFNVGDHVWTYNMTPVDLRITQSSPATITAVGASSFTVSITCTANETSTVNGIAISSLVQPTAASAAASGVVTLTFSHNPFHAGNANVDGDVVTVTGMTPSCMNTAAGTGAVVQSSTATSLTYNSSCSAAQSASVIGTVGSGPGYTTIAQLNTNWGTGNFYTTFGSTASTFTDTCGSGSASSYSCTLSHTPVDYFSPVVKVSGSIVAAMTANTTTDIWLYGPTVPVADSIVPSTGATTIVFSGTQSAAPTVTYTTGGYGHGTGLLDENGSHTTWLGSRSGNLSGAAAGVKTDLGHWLYHWAYWLYNGYTQAARRYAHHGMLSAGIDTLNGHNGITPSQIVLAATQNADVLDVELGTYGYGDPDHLAVTSDSCSANVATITATSAIPAWIVAGVPVTVTGTSNDSGAFNNNPQVPWNAASVAGSSITFSQNFNGTPLSCANLSTTTDSGSIYLDVRQATLNAMYQDAGDFPILVSVFDLSTADSEFYQHPQIGPPSSPSGYSFNGGEFGGASEEDKGRIADSEVKWLLTAQPSGGNTYPVLGYEFFDWRDGVDSYGVGYGLVSTCDNSHNGYETGTAVGVDSLTNYPFGPCSSVSSVGRYNIISGTYPGYLTFFIAPGSIPAAGTPITITYTSSGTQYTETIATGDGVTNGYYYWTLHTPITAGTVTIKAGATTLGTDNGAGLLSGAGLVANGSPNGDAVSGIRNANGEWLKTIVPWTTRTKGAPSGTAH